jgi:hypothetical protein
MSVVIDTGIPIPSRKTPAEVMLEHASAINLAFQTLQPGQSIFVPDAWNVPAKILRPPDACLTRAIRMSETDAGAVFEGGVFVPGTRHYCVGIKTD